MELSAAQNIANQVFEKLKPFCTKINIAGSIRRQKPDVKDIEIVCLPNQVVAGQDTLFDEGTRFFMVSPDFEKAVNSLGTILKGHAGGKYMQIHLPDGINLDLFMPDDFDYYRQFAIRTGSADYAAKTIATGWRKIGWCGSDAGLRKMADCLQTKLPNGKSKWKCINRFAEKPPIWTSEEDFFNWINVPFFNPEKRS